MIRLLIVLSWLGAATAAADIALPCTTVKDAVFDAEHGGCVKRSKSVDPVTAAYYAGLDALAKDPKTAFAMFEKACKAKLAAGCSKLASMYDTGRARVVTRDVARARELFKQACTLGDGPACQRTGNYVMSNEPAEARKYFERACSKFNDGIACAQLAFMIDQGMGGAADPARAAKEYAKAWKLLDRNCPKDGNACLARGVMLQRGLGTKVDDAKALAAFRQSCADANYDGCTQLAQTLDKLPGNAAEALGAWEKGCLYDWARACSVAARRLVAADHRSTDAMALAERACELDTTECEILALIYDLGYGTLARADRARATTLFKTLCDAGDQSNCVRFANRARRGIGIAADAATADKLLEAACATDEASACGELGHQFTANKRDDAHGFVVAQKGCNLGSAFSCYVAGWMVKFNRRGAAKLDDAPAAKEALPYFDKGCAAEEPSPAACHEAGKLYDNGLGTNEDKTAAAERYKKACNADDDVQADSCLALAVLHLEGTGSLKKDPAEGLRLVARACANGNSTGCEWLPAHAKTPDELKVVTAALAPVCATGEHEDVCLQLAFTLANGAGPDKRASTEVFEKMCGRKDPRGCRYHAEATYYGWGALQDKARGEALFKQLCEEPASAEGEHPAEAAACFDLVRAYMEQKKDNQLILQYADLACKLGNGDGCNTVAYLHYTAAKGITWSATIAADYYKKGCDKHSAMSCANTAELYRYGIAIPRDPAAAAKLYKQVCDDGSGFGCAGYGHYLATGEGGVTRDVKTAEKLLRDACKQETSEACIELADLLAATKTGTVAEIAELRGQGVTITERNAEDNPEYMWRMGVFYRDGVAKPKDLVKAREWFAKSCDKYDPLGCLDAGKAFAAIDRDRARVYFANACGSRIQEACDGAKALEGPVGVGPQKVHAKGCAGCSTGGDAGPLALVALILLRRRPRSRAAASRDRAPASRA